jgi:hypothetical protein
MRAMKLIYLCAVALFVMCVATACASGETPHFEFVGSKTFSSKSGSLTLETTKSEKVVCKKMTAKGEIKGESGSDEVADLSPVFNECTTTVLLKTYKCHSAGATEEEIKGFALTGRLGEISVSKEEVGILLSPEAGRAGNPSDLFAEFTCTKGAESIEVKVKGSVIGLVKSIGKDIAPGESFSVDFSKGAKEGESLDKKFEGEAENELLTKTSLSKEFVRSAVEGDFEVYPEGETEISIDSPHWRSEGTMLAPSNEAGALDVLTGTGEGTVKIKDTQTDLITICKMQDKGIIWNPGGDFSGRGKVTEVTFNTCTADGCATASVTAEGLPWTMNLELTDPTRVNIFAIGLTVSCGMEEIEYEFGLSSAPIYNGNGRGQGACTSSERTTVITVRSTMAARGRAGGAIIEGNDCIWGATKAEEKITVNAP